MRQFHALMKRHLARLGPAKPAKPSFSAKPQSVEEQIMVAKVLNKMFGGRDLTGG